jgi:hypothetical protein
MEQKPALLTSLAAGSTHALVAIGILIMHSFTEKL